MTQPLDPVPLRQEINEQPGASSRFRGLMAIMTFIALVIAAPVSLAEPTQTAIANAALALVAALIVHRRATWIVTAVAVFLPAALFAAGVIGIVLR